MRNAALNVGLLANAVDAEYVPYALVLMGLAKGLMTSNWLLYPCGIALVIGRTIHAYGISQTPERIMFRQIGMDGTFTMLGVLAAVCVVGAMQVLG